jgi:divalent metal cation (Fe/Co/Zn/Cd) transporter
MSATSQPTHNLRRLTELARTFFEPFPFLVLLMLFKSFLWIPGGGSRALVADIVHRMM